MLDKAGAIQGYILAKDGNRPFMLNTAFAKDATVQMNVRTKSISFPSVMSEKLNRSLRVGCGSYEWQFCSVDNRVQSLSITIDKMEPASAESVAEVMDWISDLAYPWCEFSAIAKEPPNNEVLLSVVRTLESNVIKSVHSKTVLRKS